jgi:hypothetical protein
MDHHMEKVWLRWFIRDDAFNNPNYYVSALKAIRTCRSGVLRHAAWEEIQRLGQPALKPETAEKMHGRIQKAYDALKVQMLTESHTPSKGMEGVSKPHRRCHMHLLLPLRVEMPVVTQPTAQGWACAQTAATVLWWTWI